jgi:hypothetical protein
MFSGALGPDHRTSMIENVLPPLVGKTVGSIGTRGIA